MASVLPDQVKFSDLLSAGLVVDASSITANDLVLLASKKAGGAMAFDSKVAKFSDIQYAAIQTDEILKPSASSLALSYDSAKKVINLKANGSVSLGQVECQDFIKDGILESVRYDKPTKQLIFTFNSAASTPSISVELTALADVYTADEVTLHLDNTNKFSATAAVARLSSLNAVSADVAGKISSLSDDYAVRMPSAESRITELESQVSAMDVPAVCALVGTISSSVSSISSDISALSSDVTDLSTRFRDAGIDSLRGDVNALSSGMSSCLSVDEAGLTQRSIRFGNDVTMMSSVGFDVNGVVTANKVLATDDYDRITFAYPVSAIAAVTSLTASAQGQIDALAESASISASQLASRILDNSLSIAAVSSAVAVSAVSISSRLLTAEDRINTISISAPAWSMAATRSENNAARLDGLGTYSSQSYSIVSQAEFDDLSVAGALDENTFYFVRDNSEVKCAVAWLDDAGGEMKREIVDAGTFIDLTREPAVPPRDYHSSHRWLDAGFNPVSFPVRVLGDMQLNLEYIPDVYELTFAYEDGSEVSAPVSREYTEDEVFPDEYVDIPAVAGKLGYWTPAFVQPLTSDQRFMLRYVDEGTPLVASFVGHDGSVVKTLDLSAGDEVYPYEVDAPDVEGMVFVHWRLDGNAAPEVVRVFQNAEFQAVYAPADESEPES